MIGESWLAAAMIGDGAVVKMDDDGSFSTVCAPQIGEFANETFAITLADALDKVTYYGSQESVQNLGIISDGLLRIAIHHVDYSPHVPFFAPLFRQLGRITDAEKAAQSLADFLASEKVRNLSGDDKTLVLVGRKSKEI